jgi:hypothetical protein
VTLRIRSGDDGAGEKANVRSRNMSPNAEPPLDATTTQRTTETTSSGSATAEAATPAEAARTEESAQREETQPIGSFDLEQLRDEGRRAIERVGAKMKRPTVGAAVAGAIVLGAAAGFGVTEAALAVGAAYVVYRLLRKKAA